MRKHKSLYERLEERIDKSGDCWIWKGSSDNKGYGFISSNGVLMRTHRVSYEKEYGPIPDGLFICHKCDNPPCVRPSHLFAGTPRDNSLDMIRKGRGPNGGKPPEFRPDNRGMNNGQSKLTDFDVLEIRRRRRNGEYGRSLANEFGVTEALVSMIVNRKKWGWLE